MTAYYNEHDPFAAQWLRNLIAGGLIAPGDVDTRSIVDVQVSDLNGYVQCHFFAGIGIWSHALRAAGWPDDRPMWTGSCPCQPFSGAGKGKGFADERHLWPVWFRLIQECRPSTLIGEQVEGPAGRAWLDLVHADLEGAGYAVGAAVLCSAGVGAPNIRHRLYWVADTNRDGCAARRTNHAATWDDLLSGSGTASRLGDSFHQGLPDTESPHLCGTRRRPEGRATEQPIGPFDPWRGLEWIDCRDGKKRPAQSPFLGVAPGDTAGVERMRAEFFPLAPRRPGDVGRLRGYGNAINAVVAREFIAAYLDLAP